MGLRRLIRSRLARPGLMLLVGVCAVLGPALYGLPRDNRAHEVLVDDGGIGTDAQHIAQLVDARGIEDRDDALIECDRRLHLGLSEHARDRARTGRLDREVPLHHEAAARLVLLGMRGGGRR